MKIVLQVLIVCLLLSSYYGVPISPRCSTKESLVTVFGNHYDHADCLDIRYEELAVKLQSIKDFYASSEKAKAGLTSYLPLGSLTSMVSDTLTVIHNHVTKPLKAAIICTGCKSVVQTVQLELNSGKSEDEIISLVGELCTYFQIFSEDICSQYLDIIAPSMLYILNGTQLAPEAVCSFVMPSQCDIETPPELDWTINLPDRLVTAPKRKPMPLDGKPVLKVLHLSDTHFDTDYVEGSLDECALPLCCRGDPLPSNESSRAGRWGGWKCDIPERTLDSLLEFVVNNITDIDHVIWTGDIPAHDLWGQSKEKNLDMIDQTVAKLKKYFNYQSMVLPSIGNHEPVPGNLLPTPSISDRDNQWSNSWLYDRLSQHWTETWLDMSKAATIKRGGYYMNAYRPGLLMISLNSVFCYTNNWWLILDNNDPGGELDWLVQTLAQAELLGEKVHISAHIPPGNFECLKVWQKNYYRIIERFNDTVVAQFFGHTHNDEFQLILNSDDPSKTTSVMFVGPSATTYTMLNPGFRILYIDGDHENTTREVLDYETWVMDLQESNKNDNPVWRKLYSAKDAFQMESLKPEEWRKVYENLKTNDTLLENYHRYFWKDSPKRPECDEPCREQYLCSIVSCVQYGTTDF